MEELVLDTIKARRRARGEENWTPSQIVADGLWTLLTEVEKVTREDIELLMPHNGLGEQRPANLKEFPKKT